jgi:hypothetical protein
MTTLELELTIMCPVFELIARGKCTDAGIINGRVRLISKKGVGDYLINFFSGT